MKNVSRRTFFKGAAATGAVAAAGSMLAACGGQGGGSAAPAGSEAGSAPVETSAAAATSAPVAGGEVADGMIPLTIGYWGGNCCELGVYTAIENHTFEEVGIQPNVVTITADTSELLANDEIDFFLWTPGFFLSWLQGANAKLIDTMHMGCWSGITLEGNGIDSPADLKGRKVGCPSSLTGPSYVETNALYSRATGGKGPEDIDWVVYDGSLLLQALLDGEVDAIIGIDSTLYPQVRENENAKFFFISAQELSDYYCCFICINTHTMDKYPDAADKLVQAFAKADDIMRGDIDAAVEKAIELGYTVGSYPGIEKGLAHNYLYGHGNEEDFWASIRERWDELRVAGFLPDCPEDEEGMNAYLDELTKGIGEWHGDVASETAAKPLSEQVKERCDAFGVNAEDIRNA